ncbi:uncharacterized protein BJ171DRAFT_308044 [Polychytrium aggregatum]|uniref:uncharacterized protein n=1 Tax=Polychytrium aggregatum TaxID=110093 RepID=UPI0022FEF5DD|nr:uncharacterized protein BJ171DRAFT_308044 [Polychytrium aggregatum]KAI9206874.1 hypothetical protein BJ171DRAFT_308044 [Polychytrium aggregatum]
MSTTVSRPDLILSILPPSHPATDFVQGFNGIGKPFTVAGIIHIKNKSFDSHTVPLLSVSLVGTMTYPAMVMVPDGTRMPIKTPKTAKPEEVFFNQTVTFIDPKAKDEPAALGPGIADIWPFTFLVENTLLPPASDAKSRPVTRPSSLPFVSYHLLVRYRKGGDPPSLVYEETMALNTLPRYDASLVRKVMRSPKHTFKLMDTLVAAEFKFPALNFAAGDDITVSFRCISRSHRDRVESLTFHLKEYVYVETGTGDDITSASLEALENASTPVQISAAQNGNFVNDTQVSLRCPTFPRSSYNYSLATIAADKKSAPRWIKVEVRHAVSLKIHYRSLPRNSSPAPTFAESFFSPGLSFGLPLYTATSTGSAHSYSASPPKTPPPRTPPPPYSSPTPGELEDTLYEFPITVASFDRKSARSASRKHEDLIWTSLSDTAIQKEYSIMDNVYGTSIDVAFQDWKKKKEILVAKIMDFGDYFHAPAETSSPSPLHRPAASSAIPVPTLNSAATAAASTSVPASVPASVPVSVSPPKPTSAAASLASTAASQATNTTTTMSPATSLSPTTNLASMVSSIVSAPTSGDRKFTSAPLNSSPLSDRKLGSHTPPHSGPSSPDPGAAATLPSTMSNDRRVSASASNSNRGRWSLIDAARYYFAHS